MPSGIYDHSKHPALFKSGYEPWNKGKTKYEYLKEELNYLTSVKKLTDKQISKVLKYPRALLLILESDLVLKL